MSMRRMIRWFVFGSLTFVAGLGMFGCSSSDKNGFPCAIQAPLCPDSYACINGVCWRNGTAPGVDGSVPGVDGSAVQTLDGPTTPVDGPRQTGLDGAYDSAVSPVDLGGAHDIGTGGDTVATGIDATDSMGTQADVPVSVDATADVPISSDVSISVDVGSDITVNACATAANGVSCGTGKVCNAGDCQDGCWIAGAFVASGGGNASNVCQICVPGKSTTDWSNNDAKTAVPCGSCSGTAACIGGALGPCSATTHTFYPDNDGDGYGLATAPRTGCAVPAGFVENKNDCCDSDPDAFPGQTKTFSVANKCGSFDYNCDGKETPKSNGPTSCGPSNCVVVETSSGKACVQQGCAGCDSTCDTWTIAACGETYYASGSSCGTYVAVSGSCQGGGGGGPAGTQECN